MGILIKNGTIVTASDRQLGDVYCDGGRIAALGPDLDAHKNSTDEVLDASGQYVFPGGIDPHVHMELPLAGTVSGDDFESGTAAGIAGGTTSIIDFVIPTRGDDLMLALAERRRDARKAVADYGLHMAVTWWGHRTAEWMARCVHHEGIPSFKAFMAYRGTVGVDNRELFEIMRVASDLGALVMVHAEDDETIERLQQECIAAGQVAPRYHALTRPPAAEGQATARAIELGRAADQPTYVVHVTCREAVQAIAAAQTEGLCVYGETCAQYLLLDDSVYDRGDFEGAAFVLSPPIRTAEHQEVLWQALKSGALQVLATDHCPFDLHGQKDLGEDDFRLIPNGAGGIEHRLALLYTYGVGAGRLSLEEFVDLTSTRAARLFGLYPRKGSISVGADADLVVWDPAATGTISARTHHQRCDRNIFEGFELKGLPSHVVANGRVQYAAGILEVERGAGRYLERARG